MYYFSSFYSSFIACGVEECDLTASPLDENLICTVTPFGDYSHPCYGEWSYATCECEANYAISYTDGTFWCEDGSFDSTMYNVECFGKFSLLFV